MIHSVTAYSLEASATLHEQHPPSMCGFPHNNGICHSSIQIFLLFFQNNCKYIEQYMLYFPSSNQLHIHKTLPLIPCQVCGVLDCANPVTVAQVCPSVENTGVILWDITFFTILSRPSPVYLIHAWTCYSSENSFYQNIQFSQVRFTCSSSDLPGNWFMDLQMSVVPYMRVLSAKIQLFQH